MGNLTLQPGNTNIVFLSRQVNGRFEIERFETNNQGKTWDIRPVTRNSALDQVRPYVPRNQSKNAKNVVFWMENKQYIHFTKYDTRIKYLVED